MPSVFCVYEAYNHKTGRFTLPVSDYWLLTTDYLIAYSSLV